MPSVAIVVVTHNSGDFFTKLLSSLKAQTLPIDHLILVDAGSLERSYLKEVTTSGIKNTLIECPNIGFSEGNNLGWQSAKGYDYVFFLNPDAFPTPTFIEQAVMYMELPNNEDVGVLTGSLLGYDIESGLPTGLIDSTGITRSMLGHLVDRDQGRPVVVLRKYKGPNLVSGICGAALFCRKSALMQVAPNGKVFDPNFFMYKEDVDLTWRIRKAGWKLVHSPNMTIYHCRGWKVRSEMPRQAKLYSARNEVHLYLKHPSLYIVRAFIKYLVVYVFNI